MSQNPSEEGNSQAICFGVLSNTFLEGCSIQFLEMLIRTPFPRNSHVASIYCILEFDFRRDAPDLPDIPKVTATVGRTLHSNIPNRCEAETREIHSTTSMTTVIPRFALHLEQFAEIVVSRVPFLLWNLLVAVSDYERSFDWATFPIFLQTDVTRSKFQEIP